MKDFGPTSNSGYSLSAEVKKTGPAFFSLRVQLTSPAAGGKVYWLFHNSFQPTIEYECPIAATGASYETTVNEAFWIGAVIPVAGGSAVRLSMWLGDATGSTPDFLPKTNVN